MEIRLENLLITFHVHCHPPWHSGAISIVWQIWNIVISAKNSIFRCLKPFLLCRWSSSGIATLIFLDLLQIHTCISLWAGVNASFEESSCEVQSLAAPCAEWLSWESTEMKMLSICCTAWCVQKLPALRITGCHTLVKWPPAPGIVTGLWSAN